MVVKLIALELINSDIFLFLSFSLMGVNTVVETLLRS